MARLAVLEAELAADVIEYFVRALDALESEQLPIQLGRYAGAVLTGHFFRARASATMKYASNFRDVTAR